MMGLTDSTRLDASDTGHSISSDDGSVPVLEPALWKRLLDARRFDELACAWLALQCDVIGDVLSAVVVRIGDDGQYNGIAVWPAGTTDVSSLSPIVDLTVLHQRGIVQRAGLAEIASIETKERDTRESREFTRIAYPLKLEDALVGAVALEIDTAATDSVRRAMRDLQWGIAWLRERLLWEQAVVHRSNAEHASAALDLLATALEEERFTDACRAVTTEIAVRTKCDRVSIGFRRSGTSVVESISHSARFGKRMNLVHMLGTAMDEAIDQRAVISYPAEEDVPHVRAHQELARTHASGAILTVPMFVHDTFVGAICFERGENRPFGGDETAYSEAICAAVGPILVEKKNNDRWIGIKIIEAVFRQLRRLLGPGYFKRKLSVVCLLLVVVFFYFTTSTYYVTSDAVVEGHVQRAVVAPFDGFIKDVPAGVGDTVERGKLIVSLDDRDLVLERMRWITERQKSLHEYERALGERNRVESRIAEARTRHADAWIALIDQKISRTRLVAPFDGVVISGDMSRSIGTAVQRGQVLFEIALLDSYRVILDVEQSQVRDVGQGSRGRLRVASLPNETFPLVVDNVSPVAVAEEGQNHLRVEALIEGEAPRLRPGMSGVGHIDVDQRRLIWIWTRAFLDWLQVVVWRWFG